VSGFFYVYGASLPDYLFIQTKLKAFIFNYIESKVHFMLDPVIIWAFNNRISQTSEISAVSAGEIQL
jgi:hypothetical protein